MKRFLSALLMICMLLTLNAPAMAAALPAVSFRTETGAINGGCVYELIVKVSKPQTEDLPVQVRNTVTDEVFTVVIPAGEKQGSCQIATEVVEARSKITFAIEKSDAYKGSGRHALTVHTMPRMSFTADVMLGALGRKATVKMKCANPTSVIKGSNTYQLRNSEGVVLAEKAWPLGSKEASFSFQVEESMLGRQDLSLWLGEYCLTAEEGYSSLADTSRKVILRLAPEVPLMAMGIDCAYDDTKTDEILAVLEKHNVKVTFFVTGYFLRTFPDAVRKMVDAGHEIGNHSNTHEHMLEQGIYTQYRQVARPFEDLEAMMGVTPRLFRPPFGEFNAHITSMCRGEGMEVIMWSMSYKDSLWGPSMEQLIENATTGADYGPGAIGLCHLDGVGMPDTLDAGLTYYESLGLQVVPISALIYASGGELPPMPAAREALAYTDEYWPAWLRENVPEHAWVLDK